ncbi:Reticulon-like protein 1 [Cyberlindnera fabianii]|uniref:Reticulon-like protein n=1 Tax=Cyberlindnera fabianii TaxID=36022 RepID=A0A1V2L0U7_CYBFA|nr:Reticulon-like protein 1 [Cyberlindnera fabianii]
MSHEPAQYPLEVPSQVPSQTTSTGTTGTTTTSGKKIFPSILTWKDPVKTGKVFGGVIFALIILKSVNLLSLFFRITSLTLISSGIAEYAGKVITGTGFVTRFRPAYTNAGQAVVVKILESLANSTGALSYVLYKITSWLSLYSLIFTATILGFTLPFVYETYQTEINAAVAEYSKVATAKASEYSKVAQEKAAPYIKQADEKLGPVSKFIKQKIPVRTASTTVGEKYPTKSFEPSSAKTSGAQVSAAADSIPVKNSSSTPIVSGNEFPSVPSTTPLSDQINSKIDETSSNVDVDDLKSDILKNKAAAANF